MTTFNELATIFKNIIDELFNSNGFECRKLVYGKNVYYCGRDILKCLNYSNEKSVVRKTLSKLREEDRFTIKALEKQYQGRLIKTHPAVEDVNKSLIDSLNQYEKNNIYINKQALYYLIGNSNKEEARPFKNFIYYTLLPALDDKYEELLNQKNDKIDELGLKIERLLSGVNTIKTQNDQLLDHNQKLLENTEILKNDNEVINDELNVIKEEQEDLKTAIENTLIPNRNLPPNDIKLNHSFVMYQISSSSYYCLRGQNKYVQKKLKEINPQDIIINNVNNPNPIDFYQKFKEESKRRLDELKRKIIRTLNRRIENFNHSSLAGKKLIEQNIENLKGFTINSNMLYLNKSRVEDIIDFYNFLIKEKEEY